LVKKWRILSVQIQSTTCYQKSGNLKPNLHFERKKRTNLQLTQQLSGCRRTSGWQLGRWSCPSFRLKRLSKTSGKLPRSTQSENDRQIRFIQMEIVKNYFVCNFKQEIFITFQVNKIFKFPLLCSVCAFKGINKN
jgi:hypothetical protein